MSAGFKFSPLAKMQLDNLWDYGFEKFGLELADSYIDGIFLLIKEVAESWRYQGLSPRMVPQEMLDDVTNESVYFIPYRSEVIYLKKLSGGKVGVICILGARMDTPNRIKEMISNPRSDIRF